VKKGNGQFEDAHFLVDTGADRTVLHADLLALLNLSASPPPGLTFQGIGGAASVVVVTTVLELRRTDGILVHFHGQFAAFTDPRAADRSVLGRDVLDHFDVIVSKRRNQVLLVAGNHQYVISP
jgi:hypothetical protein